MTTLTTKELKIVLSNICLNTKTPTPFNPTKLETDRMGVTTARNINGNVIIIGTYRNHKSGTGYTRYACIENENKFFHF